MDKAYLKKLVSAALSEDIKNGDITTRALFPDAINVTAKIIAKESGVVCGVAVVEEVFKVAEKKIRENKDRKGIDRGKGIRVYCKVKDGTDVKRGQVICVVEGDARAILAAERTALNFLGRLSGIATLTRKYVNAVKPYKVKIMDTRKTTPGLRALEKYAVKTGRGYNHRMGLWDQALIKDNHIKVYGIRCKVYGKKMKLADIIKETRKKTKKKVEVEVENLKEFKEAFEVKPDIIMLDNMRISDIKRAVIIRNTSSPLTVHRKPYTYNVQPQLEVSGGVTLANVRAIAKTGIDMVSIGALTHSSRALDFSLEIQ